MGPQKPPTSRSGITIPLWLVLLVILMVVAAVLWFLVPLPDSTTGAHVGWFMAGITP